MTNGIKNNNPLNIRRGLKKFNGMAEQQNDSLYLTFDSLEEGYMVAWIELMGMMYEISRKGRLCTLSNLIKLRAERYDIADVASYTKKVSDISGIAPHKALSLTAALEDLEEMSALVALMIALTCVECNVEPKEVDTDAMSKGFGMIFAV